MIHDLETNRKIRGYFMLRTSTTMNVKNIYESPAYMSYFYGRLLRDEAEKILRNRGCKNGLFLLRELVQEAGSYAMSICHKGNNF